MTKKANFDPRVDAYIAKSPAFAQPILKTLREAVHAGCPDVQETMKWSRPHFDYKGILCGMSAFKAHCSFGFWKGSLIVPKSENKNDEGMGQLGRLTSVDDLPSKSTLIAYVKAAAKLNDAGVKSPMMANRKPRKPLPMHPALAASLKKNKKAQSAFAEFSPSQQREYIEWISEAKTDETRERRLETALEWIAEGKTRNWKYQK